MSFICVYHDGEKAIAASDDRMCSEDPATLVKQRIDGRLNKIIVLPNNMIFGTVGIVTLTEKLFRGITRMCQAHDLHFEQLAAALPEILRLTWRDRTPVALSAEVNKQDALLLGLDCTGKIRCLAFRLEDNFTPIETTASPGNRIVVLGGFELVDQERLQDFTMRVGLKGERKSAPWIASKIRDLVNEISALHPEAIGRASYFAAMRRDGLVELPEEFALPPNVDGLESTAVGGVLAEAGRFYLGSIITPAAGAPDTTGNNDGGVGAQMGNLSILNMVGVSPSGQTFGVGASITNFSNAVDGDLTTFATIEVDAPGGGGPVSAGLYLGGAPGIKGAYSSATLKIMMAVPTNSLTPAASSDIDLFYGTNGWSLTSPGVINAPNTGIVLISPPTTTSPTIYPVTLPLGLNLSQVAVRVDVVSNGSTSGKSIVDFYGAWIEVVQ